MFSGLMESIYTLMSGPATCNHGTIFLAVRELLMKLTGTIPGLLYLSSRSETINGILRTLTQNPPPVRLATSTRLAISVCAVIDRFSV